MQAWPWQTAASTVILSRQFMMRLTCKSGFNMREGA